MNLTPLQHRLLTRLSLGAYTSGDLARFVNETPSTVAHQLLPLRNEGWVFSTRGFQDQHVTWELSQYGQQCLRVLKSIAEVTVPPVKKPSTYILWCPTSKLAPSVTYPNRAKAVEVQQIMAKRYSGHVFHICEVQDGLVAVQEIKFNEVNV